MSIEDTIREQMIAALKSPEGQEAIRRAVGAVPDAPAPPIPFPVTSRPLTTSEAAERANRHPDTIRRAINAKKLRARKPPGSREWLIEPEDFHAWRHGGGSAEVDIGAELQKSLRQARGSGR